MMKSARTLPVFRTLFAFLACVGLLTVSNAQTTFDWTGSESTLWSTADNWNPSAEAPPGTSDIARFNTSVLNNPNLSSNTTIGNLQFISGSGAYTFSGSNLSIGGSSSTKITNTSGQLQSFSNQVTLIGDATKHISVGSGSSLTFATLAVSGQTARRNLSINGGGTVTIDAWGSTGNDRLNQLIAIEGTTINWNVTTGFIVQNFMANNGRINLSANTGTSGISLSLLGETSQIYLTADALTVTSENLRFRGDGGDGKTLTFGANIAGTANATYSGTVNFNDTAAGTNQTYRLYAAANNTLILSGTLIDGFTPGSGNKVEITGPGVVRYSGANANTSVTPTLISSDSTLELGKTAGVNAIAGSPVTVEGILRLAANNQIADATPLTLSGGTFEIGAFTDSLGALSVAASGGALDFDEKAGSITFASLASIAGTLTIQGWVEGSSSIFFTDGSGWDLTTLAQVNFVGYGAAQFNEITGELYAIPEPSTLALFALATGAGIYFRRRSVTHKA